MICHTINIKKIKFEKISLRNTTDFKLLVLISLVTFFTILTPRDVMGFKKMLLGLTLLMGFQSIINGLRNNIGILIFSIVLPALMYIVSTASTGSPTVAIKFLYPFAYILLVFPIVRYNIDILNITRNVCDIVALIIIVSCLLDYFNIVNVYENPLLILLNNNGDATTSISDYAMFRYELFLNSSSIMFFSLTYYIKHNDKIRTLFIFIALLLTGTRANIYIGTILLVFSMLVLSGKISIKASIIIGILIVAGFFGGVLFERYLIFELAKSSVDLSQLGTFTSILHAMDSDKSYWLTGMGFGSTFYDSGKLLFVDISDFSYLEFIREIGLPLSTVVFCFLLYPLLKLISIDKFLFASYLAYLFVGVFEPFIFTSTGCFVIMMVYAEVVKHSNVRRNYMFYS